MPCLSSTALTLRMPSGTKGANDRDRNNAGSMSSSPRPGDRNSTDRCAEVGRYIHHKHSHVHRGRRVLCRLVLILASLVHCDRPASCFRTKLRSACTVTWRHRLRGLLHHWVTRLAPCPLGNSHRPHIPAYLRLPPGRSAMQILDLSSPKSIFPSVGGTPKRCAKTDRTTLHRGALRIPTRSLESRETETKLLSRD